LRRFVLNFVEIVKPISKMLNKGEKMDWTIKALNEFISIKRDIKEAPILKSLDCSKPFQFCSFASYHTIVAVML
jgi:hypothetical protein